jgi:hypothetical protein
MQRRLATILVADIAGYSRLMEAAEESTAARLEGEQPYAQRAWRDPAKRKQIFESLVEAGLPP